MWRSFFYALGVGLMVLGGEALIFERVTLNPEAKLPPFAQRLLAPDGTGPNFSQPRGGPYAFGGQPNVTGIPNAVATNRGQPARVLPTPRNVGFGYASQSRFGPSRFAGPANGGYGGGRIGLPQGSPSGNPLAGRSTTSVQLVSNSSAVGTGFAGARNGLRKQIITKDWMPWSMIAVGAVIFLYTHTSRRRYSD